MPPRQVPSPVQKLAPAFIQPFRTNLLAWYARAARKLPWRALPVDHPETPYHLWLAEVMLQQTTVATVIPYYHRFLIRFPTLATLATAPLDDLLGLWQGLGYYRRAHLLHRAAQALHTHGGLPTTEAALLAIPGFGPYTAAAVAAQAFNQPATVVDGNVERVLSRVFALTTPLPAGKPIVRHYATQLTDPQHPGTYANAIMELGATVCLPRNPLCLTCPLQPQCAASQLGTPTAFPLKTAKAKLPQKTGTAYLLTDPTNQHLYLRRRPATGLLSGLYECPHTGWEAPASETLNQFTGIKNPGPNLLPAGTAIQHTFTHFHLTLFVAHYQLKTIPPAHCFALTQLPALPTLMRKVIRTAFPEI